MGIKTKKHDSNITKIPKNTVRSGELFPLSPGAWARYHDV